MVQDLTSGSIPQHVRRIALPSSIGWFFQTMYNVVDSFYAGQISTLALAALGLSFPVFLLVIASSGGLSRGSSALIANAIGSKDKQKERKYVMQSLSLGLMVSLLIAVLGPLVDRPIFQWLGATGEYLELAETYMQPIFFGAGSFVISSLCNSILLANGDSRTYSRVLITGFFLNLLLDPWFLYGGIGLPAMGIGGIAWATVVIQSAGCLFLLSVVYSRRLLVLDSIADFVPDWRIYRDLIQQSVPASFSILSVSLGFFMITYLLRPFGESAVAAFGVGTRIEQVGLLPTFGLYGAIIALVGQNNGAQKLDRVKESLRICNRYGLLLVTSTSVLLFLAAKPLVGLFTSDPEVIEMGVHFVRLMMPIQWSYVMTSTHLAFLQAVKRPMYGFFESILRKVAVPLGILAVLVMNFDLGIDRVWFSVAIGNVFMTGVTVLFARLMLRMITDTPKA